MNDKRNIKHKKRNTRQKSRKKQFFFSFRNFKIKTIQFLLSRRIHKFRHIIFGEGRAIQLFNLICFNFYSKFLTSFIPIVATGHNP